MKALKSRIPLYLARGDHEQLKQFKSLTKMNVYWPSTKKLQDDMVPSIRVPLYESESEHEHEHEHKQTIQPS